MELNAESDTAALPARRGHAGTVVPHPLSASPLRHLMLAFRKTTAEGMNEWIADSDAARILAGRLRKDHA